MLASALYILLMVLGFGFLIFVHELGHFIAAKWAGIRAEGFAIGMGPVLMAWRRGVGMSFGSTDRKVIAKTGKPAHELSDEELVRYEVSETEYSLRALPFGGFVKMLGQDDARPGEQSEDPRSYNRCPVGKRMIVVSAGVVMNLILAAVLFVIAFSVGVRFEAPVIGEVAPNMPASNTRAINATEAGVTTVGLQPGDHVVAIDGESVDTFANIVIASAMSRPEEPVRFVVQRDGVDSLLEFDLVSEKGPEGLLSIGVGPAASARLLDGEELPIVREELERMGLLSQGVEPAMVLVETDGRPVRTFQSLHAAVMASDGAPIQTAWTRVDHEGNPLGEGVTVELPTHPELVEYGYRDATPDWGLLGMTPLVRIVGLADDTNADAVQPGDVILRVASEWFTRRSQLLTAVLGTEKGEKVDLVVLRDGERVSVTCRTNRDGLLGIRVESALDLPITAQPILVSPRRDPDDVTKLVDVATPLANEPPLAGARFLAVNGQPVSDWRSLREALRQATSAAADAGTGAEVQLRVATPTNEAEEEQLALTLTPADVERLHELGWQSDLRASLFEPLFFEKSAEGNPIAAVKMGLEETKKGVVLTYLTIDRLFRGSVSVEQLRGPVGIVDLGVKILPRGFMYFLFFLGLISVNLAVLNFLPLPIVDGGLFLFLLYEKFKGRPPSVAFQNGAFLFGIVLLGALFLYITFNDVQRLF